MVPLTLVFGKSIGKIAGVRNPPEDSGISRSIRLTLICKIPALTANANCGPLGCDPARILEGDQTGWHCLQAQAAPQALASASSMIRRMVRAQRPHCALQPRQP